jgi:hypothetical protein
MFFSLSTKAADPEFYRLYVTTKKWASSERASFLEGRVSREILHRLDSIYEESPSSYEFIYDPSSQALKVFVHCSFDIYTLRGDQLIEEYKFSNRGYTCGSYFFKRNNSFQTLGARGFWNHHADLLKFDSLKGSWEFIQTKHQPLDYYQLGAYQNSKGIVTFLGEYNNPRIPRLEKEANGFFLDLEKKSWQPIQLDIEEFNLAEIIKTNESHLYETQDYALSITTSQLPNLGWYIWILIEKESGKLYFYEGSRDTELFYSTYHEEIGNSIRYFDYYLDSDTEGKEVVINLDSIRSNSREIGHLRLIDFPEKTETTSLFSLALWIGFPAVLLLGFWMGRQLQNKKKGSTPTSIEEEIEEEDLEVENAEILQRLLLHNGGKLTTDEFDTLLGIQEITNFDSKRIKRSRLIKSLNKRYEEKNGFPLITRIKNPEDKRFVFYKITFENGN